MFYLFLLPDPYKNRDGAAIAQLGERLVRNQEVGASIRPTTITLTIYRQHSFLRSHLGVIDCGRIPPLIPLSIAPPDNTSDQGVKSPNRVKVL